MPHTSNKISMGMFGMSFRPPRLPRSCFFDAVFREVDDVAGTTSGVWAVALSLVNLALLRGDLLGGADAVVVRGICEVFTCLTRTECDGR